MPVFNFSHGQGWLGGQARRAGEDTPESPDGGRAAHEGAAKKKSGGLLRLLSQANTNHVEHTPLRSFESSSAPDDSSQQGRRRKGVKIAPLPAEGPGASIPAARTRIPKSRIAIQDHWRDPRAFRGEEARRSEINRLLAEDKKIFISHCWRKTVDPDDPDDEDLQAKKRQMIANLSTPIKDHGPGLLYWADFLDLQAEGPVPWRKEIEEAVQHCSKMVAFVDEAWLTSFNCLQELAFAINEEKPIVILVLDQEAWELITVPNGPARAWDMASWGVSLSEYDGQEITPGQKFTKEKLKDLISYIAGINLCACRRLEEANFGGMEGVMDNMRKYVTKDLLYFKQHAELKELARKWEQGNSRASLLLHRAEAEKWDNWVEAAETVGATPLPTTMQKQFVRASMQQAKMIKFRLRIAAFVLLGLILMGAVASGVMASVAVQQQKEAAKQAELALANAEEAKAQELIANQKSIEADEARVKAELAQAQAIADKIKAQKANMASTAALLLSVLGSHMEDAIMEAPELRMYIKASALLEPSQLPYMENQLDNKLMLRMRDNVWVAQPLLAGHVDSITCAAYSPANPNFLATGSHDGTVGIWNPQVSMSRSLEGHSSSVLAVEWSPLSPTLLASGSHDGTIRVWDLTLPGDSLKTSLVGHQGPVTALSWSPGNSGKLASGSEDQVVLIWNLGNGQFRELIGHQGTITALSWYPVGESQLASGSDDRTIRVWDLSTVNTANLIATHTDAVTSLAYSPVGALGAVSRLACGFADGQLLVWSVGDSGGAGIELEYSSEADTSFGQGITSIAWDSTSADHLAVVSELGVVRGYSMVAGAGATLDQLASVNPNSQDQVAYHLAQVAWADVNNTRITSAKVVQSYGPNDVHIWDHEPGALALLGHHGATKVNQLSWGPSGCSGTWLAMASAEGHIHLQDFDSGRHVDVDGHTDEVVSVSWCPNMCGVLASSSKDNTIRLTRVSEGVDSSGGWAVVGTSFELTTNSTGFKTFLQWSPQSMGNSLAYSSWNGEIGMVHISVLNTAMDKVETSTILAKASNQFSTLAWSSHPDSRLAVANTLEIQVYDTATKQAVAVLSGHTLEVLAMEWSPSNPNHLISASYDKSIILWDVQTGHQRVFEGHQGPVVSVTWAPDGMKFASASMSDSVRVWDLSSAIVKVLAATSQEPINAVGWSPGRSTIVCSSPNSSKLRVWYHIDRDTSMWRTALQDMHDGDFTLLSKDLAMYDLSAKLMDDIDMESFDGQ